MTDPTPADALKAEGRYDWRKWTIDKRGCGGCTVKQFEETQDRVLVAIIGLAR